MTPDVNVLVAAYRPDHPHHAPARTWLDSAVRAAATGATPLVLLGTVVTGFMRVTTNPKVFVEIDPMQDLTDFVDSLLSCTGVQFQAQGAGWSQLRQLCLQQQVSSNLVADAWIAASVIESGETLCTFDRDFKKLLSPDRLHLLNR
jgi:toxin-antitoxin system PIN domain toxin